jgi:hypothetical protein
MARPRMRPRFILEVACSVEDMMESLRRRIDDNAHGVQGSFSERHGVLMIPEQERRFWSPQLGVTIEDRSRQIETGEAPTRVLGIFSPHPDIWTAFVFTLGILISIGVFGSMWAIVQLSLSRPPWALLAPLAAALLGGLVYAATLVGQGLGSDETYRLRSYLDECIGDAEARAALEPRTARDSAQL